VVIGDAGRTDNLVEHVQGASALVVEATYLEQDAEMARKFGHLTAAGAARLARAAGVSSLILNHVSRRYPVRHLLAEARTVFEPVFVANDFDHFRVVRRDAAELVSQAPPWRNRRPQMKEQATDEQRGRSDRDDDPQSAREDRQDARGMGRHRQPDWLNEEP
jgi:hypothetical protein